MGVLYIIFSMLEGFCKAVSDTLAYHYYQSIFKRRNFDSQFWNAEVSWKNKYKNIDVSKKERFPLSTTLLVALTDGWHLFNFFRKMCVRLAMICLLLDMYFWFDVSQVQDGIIKVIIGEILAFSTFHLFFKYFLVSKIPFLEDLKQLKIFILEYLKVK